MVLARLAMKYQHSLSRNFWRCVVLGAGRCAVPTVGGGGVTSPSLPHIHFIHSFLPLGVASSEVHRGSRSSDAIPLKSGFTRY